MSNPTYADAYRDIDFRRHPEKYVIGKGEQGVLIAEPYKSEILPHWKFATPEKAKASSDAIYRQFIEYGKAGDFVGMDMARKFLQMGFTRARRYANHGSGNKYAADGTVRPQESSSETSDKAESARIFREKYQKALKNARYSSLKESFLDAQRNGSFDTTDK
jgi:hypothetical protein